MNAADEDNHECCPDCCTLDDGIQCHRRCTCETLELREVARFVIWLVVFIIFGWELLVLAKVIF